MFRECPVSPVHTPPSGGPRGDIVWRMSEQFDLTIVYEPGEAPSSDLAWVSSASLATARAAGLGAESANTATYKPELRIF